MSQNVPFNTKFYKLKRIPENSLGSPLAQNAFLGIIRNIQLCRETQNNIENVYDDLCVKLYKEMNDNIPSFDWSNKTKQNL